MFVHLQIIWLVHNIKGFYTEIEGMLNLGKQEKDVCFTLEPKSFYWFEVKNEIYLVYFDNSLETHEQPFLVLILVSDINKNIWFNEKNCQQIFTAFDNFYKNSAFISLIINNKQKNLYKFIVKFTNTEINGEIKVDKIQALINIGFPLKELAICASLLETVKFGTIIRNRFYQIRGIFNGIFVVTYYIIFQEVYENSKCGTLFRTADLIELGYVFFKTVSHKGKYFLTDWEYSFRKKFLQNLSGNEKNKYNLRVLASFLSETNIIFYSKESIEQNFQFIINNKIINEYVKRPSIMNLPQVGSKWYLIEFNINNKVVLELPIYFFGEKQKLSKLVFIVKFFRKIKFNELLETHTSFLIFDFNEEKNFSWIYYNEIWYNALVYYTLEDKKIIFKIREIKAKSSLQYTLIEKETTKEFEPVKKSTFTEFLNGAIIYNHSKTVLVTNSKYSLKERKSSKECQRKSISKVVYYLIILILLWVCLFFGLLYERKRIKKTHKEGRFNKMKTKKN